MRVRWSLNRDWMETGRRLRRLRRLRNQPGHVELTGDDVDLLRYALHGVGGTLQGGQAFLAFRLLALLLQ